MSPSDVFVIVVNGATMAVVAWIWRGIGYDQGRSDEYWTSRGEPTTKEWHKAQKRTAREPRTR